MGEDLRSGAEGGGVLAVGGFEAGEGGGGVDGGGEGEGDMVEEEEDERWSGEKHG